MSASSSTTHSLLEIRGEDSVSPASPVRSVTNNGGGSASVRPHQAVYHIQGDEADMLPSLERPYKARSLSKRMKNVFEEVSTFDIRPELPSWISRFLGYRAPGLSAPYQPIWALRWLDVLKIPTRVEDYVAAFFCSFTAILLICLVDSYSNLSHLSVPLSLGSAGASAVILFVTPLTPAASPRSLVFGHFIASLVSTIVTRIFLGHLQNSPNVAQGEMSRNVSWLCGCLSLAFTIFFQMITGTVHPPGGATALLGGISPGFVAIGWDFIAFTLVMTSLMLSVAMVFGNVGRRKYPLYWFSPPHTPARSIPIPPPRTEKPVIQRRTPAQILAETVEEFERLGMTGQELTIVKGAYQKISQI